MTFHNKLTGSDDPTKFVKTVHEDCCGDSVLATAMQSLDIELKTSWPSMQGETPSSLDYTGRHFCWAVVTQHHMSNEEVQDMWDFEQDWLNRNLTVSYVVPSSQPTAANKLFRVTVEP